MARTAFLFPGQGAQTVGMGRELAASSPTAQGYFARASEILGYDLLDVCSNGPAEKLNATDVSQPAIFVTSMAALATLESAEPQLRASVVATAGLSLGEYTALAFAGALTFEDGVRLVQARGRAMQAAAERTAGAMVSLIGPTVEEVTQLVESARGPEALAVANLLAPGNTVVSGSRTGVDALIALAESQGVRTVRLTVAGAFHTELMRPADAELAAALQGVALHPPQVPVWSNVDAKPHTDPVEIPQLLVRQVVAPVRWEETMRALLAEGVEQFVEIGPGRVLAGLLKRIHRKADIRNITG